MRHRWLVAVVIVLGWPTGTAARQLSVSDSLRVREEAERAVHSIWYRTKASSTQVHSDLIRLALRDLDQSGARIPGDDWVNPGIPPDQEPI
jgi:hypothetical protein